MKTPSALSDPPNINNNTPNPTYCLHSDKRTTVLPVKRPQPKQKITRRITMEGVIIIKIKMHTYKLSFFENERIKVI
jgi:hypothetical protein